MIFRALAPILSVLLLGLIAVEHYARARASDASAFHAAAAQSIGSIPARLGEWTTTDLPLPASAVTLLKPNAVLARQAERVGPGGVPEYAIPVIVQCADARDMAGHYPPVCYPGQGWKPDGPIQPVVLRCADREIRAMRYHFTRDNYDQAQEVTIFGFFAVPGPGLIDDMPAIRKLASDYTARPFGAAQLHVVLTGRQSPGRDKEIAEELFGAIGPTIALLGDAAWRNKP